MTEKTVKARITGRVQGVSYRAWTQATAHSNGLSGWVRNCGDGSVEAVFAGDADRVDAMLAACHAGPPAAEVDGVATGPADTGDMPENFEIRG
jgi:acylphosphatase